MFLSCLQQHSVDLLETLRQMYLEAKESFENGVNGLIFDSGYALMLAEKLVTILKDYKLSFQMQKLKSESVFREV